MMAMRDGRRRVMMGLCTRDVQVVVLMLMSVGMDVVIERHVIMGVVMDV